MGDWPRPQIQRRATADQLAFANVETAIAGFSWPIQASEEWEVTTHLSCTMVGTGGVKLYFTFPAGCSGEMHLMGNVATLITAQTLYAAALTVPGTFFLTGAITGRYTLTARILNATTPGTIQLVGITGGATTTCVVKRGSLLHTVRITP